MPNRGHIQINAWKGNIGQPDFRNLPHETMEEFLARGCQITKIRSNCWAEYPYRRVRQTFSRQIANDRGFFVETG